MGFMQDDNLAGQPGGAPPLPPRLTDVYTWGRGDTGALGHGLESSQSAPQLVHSLIGKRLRSVSCGGSCTAAVTHDGRVLVWGSLAQAPQQQHHHHQQQQQQQQQQASLKTVTSGPGRGLKSSGSGSHSGSSAGLGLGAPSSPDAILVPRMLVTLQGKDVRAVACGDAHLAVLTVTGEVLTMGVDTSGALGLGTAGDALAAQHSGTGPLNHGGGPGAGGQRGGAGSRGSTAGVTTLADGSRFFRHPRPVAALLGKGVRAVACGDAFSVALTDNDDVYTWGRGDEGQLGHGSWGSFALPRLVQSLRGRAVASIAAGSRHAACVTASGELYTWGCGKGGRLGHGGETDFAVGMVVKGLLDERVAQVALGTAHTIALTETRRVFTWGANHFGQLGHGHTTQLDRPREVEALRGLGVVAVRAGAYHSACLTESGAVYTWGCGNKGALGHGDAQRRTVPTEVQGLRGKACSDVSLGVQHCAAITAHVWIPDEEVDSCLQCDVEFSFFTRRSHCRHCGRIFCKSCASRYVAIPRFGFDRPVRVCDVCYEILTGSSSGGQP